MPSPRVREIVLLAVAFVAVWLVPSAAASLQDEQALADRYAPVVRLVAQAKECGYGESYEPIDVDLLFGEPTVALRGPWNRTDLVKIAPTADDLAKGLYEYHLDFPGNALAPGCTYERWAKHLTAGHPPAVYAHVAADPDHPGKLALQYWLYYVFNDWNNTHEGDWEMIQLNFDAGSPAEALTRSPTEVGYSQHEGAERAKWGESKLELVDGTHPVVHPAAGSHANFYDEALFIGSSASEGVGCDDTTGPTFDIRPVVHTIPSDPVEAKRLFPWIGFQGRWGELQRAFFNGPTGPNLKSQWTHPLAWAGGWRDRSTAVPGGGALGTGATDFFCQAVGGGSRALRRFVDHPLPGLLVIGALVALLGFGLSRATWRPALPLRFASRRSWGQILSASGRMYASRLGLFVGMGVLFLPISLLITLLQTLVLHASTVAGIQDEGEGRGVLALFVVGVGTSLTLLGLALVQAATARALVEIDGGKRIGAVRAYRLAWESILPLLLAALIYGVALAVLLSSLFLLPIAIWLAVRWALFVPAAALEGRSAFGSLRRSGVLVRRHWLKVGSLTVAGAVLVLAAGPLLGGLLILGTSLPLTLLNVLAGIVYAVAMPFVALTTAYVYVDTRIRREFDAGADRELAAEIDLTAPAPG